MADDTYERTHEAIQATLSSSEQQSIAALREIVERQSDEIHRNRSLFASVVSILENLASDIRKQISP